MRAASRASARSTRPVCSGVMQAKLPLILSSGGYGSGRRRSGMPKPVSSTRALSDAARMWSGFRSPCGRCRVGAVRQGERDSGARVQQLGQRQRFTMDQTQGRRAVVGQHQAKADRHPLASSNMVNARSALVKYSAGINSFKRNHMATSTTVAAFASVFDLGTVDAADSARQWLKENYHDRQEFDRQFPNAIVLSSVGQKRTHQP